MNNLQMSLGNSKTPLTFTLGNVELSFSDKCCKKCHAPKKFWIPPPGRTTRLCQCCWKKLPEPPTRYTVNVPVKELLENKTPFTIESSNIENFKMLFLPEASTESNKSQSTPKTAFEKIIESFNNQKSVIEEKTPFDKIIESFNMQKSVIEGAEKVLEDNEKMRNTLSANVKSLKNNVNDIGQRINEINNQDKVIKEDINITEISSTKSNQTKSVATIAKRKKIELKRKSTKDTLRSEILRVENLLKNVQKLTESKLSKEASFKVKTLETINTFETDQTDSDHWVREDFDKNNNKTIGEKSTTYELIQSLRLPHKNTKNKSIQTNFLRPIPMIKYQTPKKPHNIRQNRYMKHRAIAIHPKKTLKEAVITPNKSSIEKIQNHTTVEHLMKRLADSMRKSKKLLDSVYRQDGIVESMQNKFIQEVEKLYQEQQSMLQDLYEVSKSSIDLSHTSDISSSNESKEHYPQDQLSSRFPRNTELVEHSSPNQWNDSNEVHSFNPEEVAEEMHTIEKTLAKAQGKLLELKKEYNETTNLLLNGSTTGNNAINKSAERYKTDSGISTMPRENPDCQKVDNDIVCETVIKQTLRNVTIPELTQSNIHSPLGQSIQNINQSALQLLPSYTNPLSGISVIEGPLDSSHSLQETTKKSVRISDKFERQPPVTKPKSGRFNYTGKPSSVESFGPLSEYPFNITDSDPEESGSRRVMDTSHRKIQSPHYLRPAPKEEGLEDLKHHHKHRHKHLRHAFSDDNVTVHKFSPSSSDRSRLPEYHEWVENKPQDFSTPKAGRMKTFDHAIQVSDEDTSINNHPYHHHHHHKTQQEHHHGLHNQHHGLHNQHHGLHNQHHGSHNQHHDSHNQHHGLHNQHHHSHNSPEHHARHDLRRLRRRIDKLYEDIMST